MGLAPQSGTLLGGVSFSHVITSTQVDDVLDLPKSMSK